MKDFLSDFWQLWQLFWTDFWTDFWQIFLKDFLTDFWSEIMKDFGQIFWNFWKIFDVLNGLEYHFDTWFTEMNTYLGWHKIQLLANTSIKIRMGITKYVIHTCLCTNTYVEIYFVQQCLWRKQTTCNLIWNLLWNFHMLKS